HAVSTQYHILTLHDALPISRPRAVPREINKFARLTHAISISAADVNSRTTSAICVFPAISSRNGFMTTEWGPLKSFSVTCRLNADRKSTRLNSSHDQISYAV